MPEADNNPNCIVPDALASTARRVITTTRQNTPFPFVLDAKLGNSDNGPMSETTIADTYEIPVTSISNMTAHVTQALIKVDQHHGNPLAKISQRTNGIMAAAAIINRHNRRPPLYAETTIRTLIDMGTCTAERSPLIRAAGYVAPPPITPRQHDVDFVMADIAAHMARSHEPQTTAQVLGSLEHRQDELAQWPQLDLELFIRRVANLKRDDDGLFHPDQPWGTFLSGQGLTANTVLRILGRDHEPRSTAFLVSEVERLVGHLLPTDYNVLNAVRNAAYTSDEISRRGLATFGLREWYDTPNPRNMLQRRSTTREVIHAYLTEHGPASVEEIVQRVRETSSVKEATIREVINRDGSHRFLQLADRRLAANPVPDGHNPNVPPLSVVPDGRCQPPAPVLLESELAWLTRYVQALDDLEPPLPIKVPLTGARVSGSTLDDPMEIVVVVADRDRPSLEPRLAEIAAAASEAAPSLRPSISIVSSQQWDHQQANEHPTAHYNVWLATDAD